MNRPKKHCVTCGNTFEQLTDKYRKNCYGCVPFGTRTFKKDRTGDIVCVVCSRPYVYDRNKGHTRSKCGSCSVNQRKKYIKTKAVEYKGGSCLLCGYNKCLRSLVFHHLDESEKDFGIGGSHTRRWELLQRELDKCVLLCSNCHFEVHDGISVLPL